MDEGLGWPEESMMPLIMDLTTMKEKLKMKDNAKTTTKPKTRTKAKLMEPMPRTAENFQRIRQSLKRNLSLADTYAADGAFLSCISHLSWALIHAIGAHTTQQMILMGIKEAKPKQVKPPQPQPRQSKGSQRDKRDREKEVS